MELKQWKEHQETLPLLGELDPLFEERLNRELSGWPEDAEIDWQVSTTEKEDDYMVLRADLEGIRPEDIDASAVEVLFKGRTLEVTIPIAKG